MKTKDVIANIIKDSLKKQSHAIAEDDAKKILSAYGIPVVPENRVQTPQAAVNASAQMGFPVVIKAVGSKILHKTESGLVQVGLTSETEVAAAARKMQTAAGDQLEGFLVQPKILGQRELVAGMFRDPLFGPVVMFGLGGILTEALGDVVYKVAPLTPADVAAMSEEIQSKKLLGAFRGESAVDREHLRNTLMGLSDLALAYPQIKEIDINPLIVRPDGRLTAVDALIITKETDSAGTRPKSIDLDKLRSCYYPKSIAFVGASGGFSKWGHMLPTCVLNRNYKGQVYLVNARGGQLFGRTAYKVITEIKEDIDLAVVMIPAAKVLEQIPLLREKKVKALLLISSGFRELGEKGRQLEDQVVSACHQAGILLFGPNTMGICNPHADLFCTGSHVYPLPGSTSLVCQSGNMGTQLLAFAEQQDIGIRAFSGSGNEAMVTIEDYMEVFEVDQLTRTVVLYLESIKDGRRFFESARRVSLKKPVVVLKGGRTQKGGLAASSHTGALASDHRIFNAACKQAGIIQVRQPMEMLDLSAVFSSLPLPKGNRVAIMTLGGGWGVVATDLLSEHDLAIPDLSEDIIRQFDRLLPDYWSRANPVDIVGEMDHTVFMTAIEALLKWDGCDAVIHLGIDGRRILLEKTLDAAAKTDPGYSSEDIAAIRQMGADFEQQYIEHVIRLTETYDKPVLGVSLLTDDRSKTLHQLEDCNYKGVFFPSPERAVKALAGMCRYQQWVNANT